MSKTLRTTFSIVLIAVLVAPSAYTPLTAQAPADLYSENVYYPTNFSNLYIFTGSSGLPANSSVILSLSYYDGFISGSLDANLTSPEDTNLTVTVSLNYLSDTNFSVDTVVGEDIIEVNATISNTKYVADQSRQVEASVAFYLETLTVASTANFTTNITGDYMLVFQENRSIAGAIGAQSLSIAINGSLEISTGTGWVWIDTNATIDVDTQPPFLSAIVAQLINQTLTNIKDSLPPGLNLESYIDPEDPSVVNVRVYGNITITKGIMESMGLDLPVPGLLEPADFDSTLVPLFNVTRILAELELNASLDNRLASITGDLSGLIEGDVSIPGSIAINEASLLLIANSTLALLQFEVSGSSAEPFTPFAVNKKLLEAILESMMPPQLNSILVKFEGYEGVTFILDDYEYTSITFTEENATRIEDLVLSYNGTTSFMQDDTLYIISDSTATVGLGMIGATEEAEVYGDSVVIAIGGAIFTRDYSIEFNSPSGEFSIEITRGSIIYGNIIIDDVALDEAKAIVASVVEGYEAVGPGIYVDVGEGSEAVIVVGIPAPSLPEGATLYILKVEDDGSYTLISDYSIEDGMIWIEASSFSTLIPVVASQPQEETETETTETEETATDTTTTTTTTIEEEETTTTEEEDEETTTTETEEEEAETETVTETEATETEGEAEATGAVGRAEEEQTTTTEEEAGAVEDAMITETRSPEEPEAEGPPVDKQEEAEEGEEGLPSWVLVVLIVLLSATIMGYYLLRR